MKQDFLHDAEKYKEKHQRKKRWYKVVTCLAAFVVFCTTYALILPAITLEKGECDIQEHTHTDACYEPAETVTKRILVCNEENLNLHRHTEDCYNENGELMCGYADFVVHQHDDSCYDENGMLCCLFREIKAHTHDQSCYTTEEEPSLICEEEEIILHEHTEDCFDENRNLICGKTQVLEHVHTDDCFESVEETVGTPTLICGMEEHVHSEACQKAAETVEEELQEEVLSEEEQEIQDQDRVNEVIARIDALPSSEEVEKTLTEYEEAGDDEGYETYYLEVSTEARTVYAYYEDLGPELQKQVTNSEKIMDLAWIWSATTLGITDTLTVYQINTYSQAVTTIAWGGSVREKISSGMGFFYWDVIVVEGNSSGKLYVDQYVTADGDKRNYRASTADGFVILLFDTSVNATVGQEVTVDFDYKSKNGYNSTGFGTIKFETDATRKPEKDNSSKLEIVPGAETRDLIEVNLYDYGNNINELYNRDSKYPGFQQEGGSKDVGDSFSKWQSFNFGNNITSDLAAGKADLTNKGGDINKTTNGANSPISGAMQTTLGSDGQPALADGTSLGYLFSNSTYATKKNSQSINGLFQYHDDTGAYTFNSRENHAQFNSGSDTFTLYKQIISSNFMMYPFGNFLPFNDIVHLSAQTSTIDRSYLETIANSAQYKYNNGAGDEYGTLSTQLKKFLTLMDKAYPNGWTGVDCMNEYFKASGIPRTFTEDEELVQNLYSIDYDEPTDFYFGMEMKMNFMQPKGGLTGNDGKQPMVFYFTGDDDVWVYIDGVLFLDLSGIHRHVGGEIDFVNGVVKYYTLDVDTGDVSTTPYKTVSFSDLVSANSLNGKGTFKDYSTHSFNFYYMERGSGSGVCRMNFNFPLLHKNTISVTKELSVDEEGKEGLLGNPDFKFQVLKENGTELFIGADVNYRILDTAGNEIGIGTTDENGVFVLKAGQTAVFSNIAENAGKYFVRELLDTDVFEQYGTISVDGSSQTMYYKVTVGSDQFNGVDSPVKDMSDGSTAFWFENKVTFNKLGSLKITKKLETNFGTSSEKKFQFKVTLDGDLLPVGTVYKVGEEIKQVAEEGIIELKPDETSVISNILAGTSFTVQETTESAKGYVVTYQLDGDNQPGDSVSGVIKVNTETTISVNNSEKGISVEIPVRKTLEKPDGKEHIYKIQLQQVNSETDMSPVSPEFTQELEFKIIDSSIEHSFKLNYLERDIGETPATYYYKITELEDSGEPNTIFDKVVYVVEVTVTKGEDGNLTAVISSVWKDGTIFTENNTLSFVNQIEWYELPDTGGIGTFPYMIGGLLLTLSAVFFLLYRFSKRGKGVHRFS